MNETQLENLTLRWLTDIGWKVVTGIDIAPGSEWPLRQDYKEVVLEHELRAALTMINSELDDHTADEVVHIVKTIDHPIPAYKNRQFHRLLLNGVKVEVHDEEGLDTEVVSLIDFNHPNNNRFLAVNQFTIQGNNQPRRPDVLLFINGLPLAVVELKNPDNEDTDVWSAFQQIQTYKNEIPDLFTYNVGNIISDGYVARVGSLTANTEWYMPWRAIEHEDDRPKLQFELETLIKGFFKRDLFLDYIRHFILFESQGKSLIKKIAGYHQFHAVRAAVKAAIIASRAEADHLQDPALIMQTKSSRDRRKGV